MTGNRRHDNGGRRNNRVERPSRRVQIASIDIFCSPLLGHHYHELSLGYACTHVPPSHWNRSRVSCIMNRCALSCGTRRGRERERENGCRPLSRSLLLASSSSSEPRSPRSRPSPTDHHSAVMAGNSFRSIDRDEWLFNRRRARKKDTRRVPSFYICIYIYIRIRSFILSARISKASTNAS